ncbi:MAG: LytTR family DNA-binding domain-containing protein [Clostridia bacterium]|nr:LytTR family DNA-binding domain-containing protein [Clostridia bacterium]
MRIAIVEDEQTAADRLTEYLARFFPERDEQYTLARFGDPVALLDHYAGYDLVFMDIEMPHMDGMEGARRLREIDSETQLIFVTNMAQYAAKGYEVEALDFVVKPVAYSDFAFKMKRALRAVQRTTGRELLIPQPSGMVRANARELCYVEVRGHRLTYRFLERAIETRGTMDDAERQLADAGYLRPHNSYLINPKYIDRVDGYTVYVHGDALPISHPRRKEFIAALTEWYAKGGAV